MVVGLVLASVAFYCETRFPAFFFFVNSSYGLRPARQIVLTRKTGGDLLEGAHYSSAWSAIVLLSMILFVASYATGLGNVPWQQGELFGLEGASLVLLLAVN